MGQTAFQAAVALYALSTVLGLSYLYSRDEKPALWQYRLLGLGLAAHGLSFALLTRAFWELPENRFFFPLNSFHGALSWLALANAMVCFLVEGIAGLRILGGFVLPWTCLAAGAALWADPAPGPLAENLRSFRMNLHPMLLMLSYAGFATASGVGAAYLIQERQIKSRKPTELCYRLPPLEALDAVHYRIVALLFPLLTAGLLMSGLWAYSAWKRGWTDPKVAATVITWVLYLVFLYLRGFAGLRGRKGVYLSLAAFGWILFSFVGVNYLSSQHGFLYGR